MVEFAAGALAAIGSAIGGSSAAAGAGALSGGLFDFLATGGAVASAAGTATSGLATAGSLLAGILGGGASVTSAMAAQRAGEAKARALMDQADDADTDARQQQIAATQRQTSLKKQLVQTLGDRDVAYAASGVDLSFGTPVVARQQAETDTTRAVALDQATTDETKARLMRRAAQFRLSANEALEAANYSSTGELLNAGYRLLRRG